MEARSKRNQELSNRELLVQQENPENLVRQMQDKIKSNTAGFGCHAHIATQQTEKEIKDVLATVLRPNNSTSE